MKKIFLAFGLPLLVSSVSFAQSNEVGAGISLAFDGSPGNYVDLGDVYNNLTFPLLLEAWVKPADYTAGAAIFTSDNDATAEQGLRVSLTPEGKVKVNSAMGWEVVRHSAEVILPIGAYRLIPGRILLFPVNPP